MNELDRKLQESLITGRRVDGDRLVLPDAVLRAALEGTRALTAGEREALQASPLTARRLRELAIARRTGRKAANDEAWFGSEGMLRAAGAGLLTRLSTDDGYWILHFSEEADGWHVCLQLLARAPFTARLLRERPVVSVTDGAGTVLLQGRLDADGECEGRWNPARPPAQHFQLHGARFTVRPEPQA